MGPRNASVQVCCCFNAFFAVTLAMSPIAHAQEPAEMAPRAGQAEVGEAHDEGTVAGQVFDATGGEPLSGVTVTIVPGERSGVTDADGRYRITRVPAATFTLRFTAPGYQPYEVTDAVVSAGQVAAFDINLSRTPEGTAGASENVFVLEAVRVSAAEVATSSRQAYVAIRRDRVAPVDVMGAQEFAKFPATDVADLVGRVQGVTVSRGQFAVIRGLSERFSVTRLNNVVLPSADPERQGFQLDLVPSRLLDGMVLTKAFSPHLPATAAAGAIDLYTQAFPTKPYTSISIGVSADEASLKGADYRTYDSDGSYDLFAIGSRGRVSTPSIPGFNTGSVDLGRSVAGASHVENMPVGYKFALFHGNTIDFDAEGRSLGYNLAISYDSSYGSVTRIDNRGRLDSGDHLDQEFASLRASTTEDSDEEVLVGLLAAVGYNFNPRHRIGLTGFVSQAGLDQVSYQRDDFVPGNVSNFPTPEYERYSENLLYRERNLSAGILDGRHLFGLNSRTRVNWTASGILTSQEEPDWRQTSYQKPSADDLFPSGNALRTWRSVDERQAVAKASVTQRLAEWKSGDLELTVGGEHNATRRSYDETDGSSSFTQRPFADPALAQLSASLATSRIPRHVDASRDISAGYVDFSVPLPRGVKIEAGLRFEDLGIDGAGVGALPGTIANSIVFYNAQSTGIPAWRSLLPVLPVTPATDINYAVNPQNLAAVEARVDRKDWFPALLLSAPLTERLTVRASWSRTLAQPSFREISNYFSYEPDSGIWQHGNSAITPPEVESYDLRLEFDLGKTNFVSVGGFLKRVDKPIEKFEAGWPVGGQDPPQIETWANNPDEAALRGVEAELRADFGFVAEFLEALSFGANYTWIDAEIDRTQLELDGNASGFGGVENIPLTRRLFDQPGWIANADLSCDIESWGSRLTVSVFAQDDVLVRASTSSSYDVYAEGYARLDAVYQQRITRALRLRVTARNLEDPERRYLYDPDLAAHVFPYRTWRDGRSYSITLTYDF